MVLTPKFSIPLLVIAAILLGLLVVLTTTIVGPTDRAVLSTGFVIDLNQTFPPGLHFFKSPFTTTHSHFMGVRSIDFEQESATNNSQHVKVTGSFAYRLNPNTLPYIDKEFGGDIGLYLTPRIHATVKDVVSEFTADQIIQQRNLISKRVIDALRSIVPIAPTTYNRKLKEPVVIVDSVSMQDVKFSQAWNDAVETKQAAEQNALAKKYQLEGARYEAQKTMVMAEADAKAMQLKASAIQRSPQLWLNTIADKWDGKTMPGTLVVGGGTPLIRTGG